MRWCFLEEILTDLEKSWFWTVFHDSFKKKLFPFDIYSLPWGNFNFEQVVPIDVRPDSWRRMSRRQGRLMTSKDLRISEIFFKERPLEVLQRWKFILGFTRLYEHQCRYAGLPMTEVASCLGGFAANGRLMAAVVLLLNAQRRPRVRAAQSNLTVGCLGTLH